MSGSIGVLFVLYGVVIASFLNVCIYRIPQKESVAAGRSYCPNCQHALCWRDLVPILSFVLLKGPLPLLSCADLSALSSGRSFGQVCFSWARICAMG